MRYSRIGFWGAQAGAVAIMGVAAAAILWLLPPAMLVPKITLLVIAMVVAIGVALSAYRSADEVILETHKSAWFWGSMAGMTVVGVVALMVLAKILPVPVLMPYPHHRPEDFYAEGILAALLVQCAGFIVFWAYHNLARRG